MRRALLFGGVFVVIGACHAFGADDPPPAAKPQADAGPVKDAAVDAKYAEVPPPSDAGVSTSPDAGLLPTNAFDNIETYDRFDNWEPDAGVLTGPFAWVAVGDPNPQNPANIVFDICPKDSACSPTRSIRIDSVPTEGESGGAFLETDLSPLTRVLRFDFALFIESPDKISHAQLVSFELEGDRFLFLEHNGDSLYIGDQIKQSNNQYSTDSVRLGFTPQGWTHYQLYIDFDRAIFAVAQTHSIYDTAKILRPGAITAFKKARIGITYQAANLDFALGFDDVGVTEKPTPVK